MRIRLIFVNYEIDGVSSFIVSVPFSVQNFSEFSDYLKDHFELPQASSQLMFSLDGFQIIHKESIQALLKENDTIKIRIKEKESLSSKRKGISLADPIKKLSKNEKTEDATTFQDFLQDMLEISQKMKGTTSKKDKSKKKSPVSSASSSSSSSPSSSESSDSEESEEHGKTSGKKGIISKKYSKIQQKESQKRQEQGVEDFTKNTAKPIENQNKQTSNSAQIVSAPSAQQATKKLEAPSNTSFKPLPTNSAQNQNTTNIKSSNIIANPQNLQAIQSKLQNTNKWWEEQQLLRKNQNATNNSNSIQSQNTSNITVQAKPISSSIPVIPSLAFKKQQDKQEPTQKPAFNLPKATKTPKKMVSSSSSSSSSSSDDSDSDAASGKPKQQVQPKIMLKAQQNKLKDTQKSSPLAGPVKENMLNLDIKNPMEIYEEKKPLWKEISGFKSKSESRAKREENQKQNEIHKNEETVKNMPTKASVLSVQPLQSSVPNQNVTQLVASLINKEIKKQQEISQESTAKIDTEETTAQTQSNLSNNSFQSKGNNFLKREDVPPFEMNGFEKVDLKSIEEYSKHTGSNFFSEGDQIYYKDIEFDEESQMPVSSSWKRATVTQAINAKQVRLSIHSTSKTESTILNTAIFTALYFKSTSSKKVEPIQGAAISNSKQIAPQEKKGESNAIVEEKTQVKSQIPKLALNPAASTGAIASNNNESHKNTFQSKPQLVGYAPADGDKDILVGRQVNFYFGDKNYFKDKYLMEHSTKHAEGYIPLDLLLGFPRIKKDVSSVKDLLDILTRFPKKTVQPLFYELDASNFLIRKRNTPLPPITSNGPRGQRQGGLQHTFSKGFDEQNYPRQNRKNQNNSNNQSENQAQTASIKASQDKIDSNLEIEKNQDNQSQEVDVVPAIQEQSAEQFSDPRKDEEMKDIEEKSQLEQTDETPTNISLETSTTSQLPLSQIIADDVHQQLMREKTQKPSLVIPQQAQQ